MSTLGRLHRAAPALRCLHWLLTIFETLSSTNMWKKSNMHPCWQKLPFELVVVIIERLCDSIDIRAISAAGTWPRLNRRGYFKDARLRKLNDLLSISPYTHRLLFPKVLSRGLWIFTGTAIGKQHLRSWTLFRPQAVHSITAVQLLIQWSDRDLDYPLSKDLFPILPNLKELQIVFKEEEPVIFLRRRALDIMYIDDDIMGLTHISSAYKCLVRTKEIDWSQVDVLVLGLRNPELAQLMADTITGKQVSTEASQIHLDSFGMIPVLELFPNH